MENIYKNNTHFNNDWQSSASDYCHKTLPEYTDRPPYKLNYSLN